MEMMDHWRSRRVWFALMLGIGAITAGFATAPPASSPQGLADWLSSETSQVVLVDDIAWEEQRSFLTETFVGRRLLFLAAPEKGQPRDLYRAYVRMGYDGQPLSLWGVRNLTRTPVGDDVALQVRGEQAVFATVAYGKIQGITVLDLDGLRSEDISGSAFERLLMHLTNWQMVGSWAGIGRTDLVFNVPSSGAEVQLNNAHLSVHFREADRDVDYDTLHRSLRALDGAQPYGVKVVPNRRPGKPFVLWSVDTVREQVGPDAISWLEQKVFGLRDAYRRLAFSLAPPAEENALRELAPVASAGESAAQKIKLPGLGNPANAPLAPAPETWPPARIESQWKKAEPGEGEWLPVRDPVLRTSSAIIAGDGQAPPAYFYKTFIRPDPQRPYAKVWLIAMDMRQLTLGMQAGFEDPEPATGPPGEGHLPEDAATVSRVVATFNGAFKSTHGKYGMMVNRRVLLPPIAEAATVAITADNQVAFGSWPTSTAIPDDLISFRQNLDPLIEDGKLNPSGRQIWGWQLQGRSVMTERTALCSTDSGHAIYAWAEEIDGHILGAALKSAGCNYGIHLDMNPGHCGLIYTRVNDVRRRDVQVKRAVDKMSVVPDRYVRWSPKDFFYVMLRDPIPHDAAGGVWQKDEGTQPPPLWWPAIFASRSEVSGSNVELLSIDRGRVQWAVRAGTLEPTSVGAPLMKTDLEQDPSRRVLIAVGLGHTTGATRYGLAFDGKAAIPFRGTAATLVMSPPYGLALSLTPPQTLQPNEEAVQLPLLARSGELTEGGRSQGVMRQRGALCIDPEGRVLIGRSKSDSSIPLAHVLLKAGCRDVVDLDRGSSHPNYLHRAGTDHPPTGGYETTTLYALAQPMLPTAVRWKPVGNRPRSTPIEVSRRDKR